MTTIVYVKNIKIKYYKLDNYIKFLKECGHTTPYTIKLSEDYSKIVV